MENLEQIIGETIAKLTEFKQQEQAILKQSDAVINKTYDTVMVDFKNPTYPDALMVFTTYINGKKHIFPFKEEISKDAFYSALANFLTELSGIVDEKKLELKNKLIELQNAL